MSSSKKPWSVDSIYRLALTRCRCGYVCAGDDDDGQMAMSPESRASGVRLRTRPESRFPEAALHDRGIFRAAVGMAVRHSSRDLENHGGWQRPALFALIGCAALLLGALVYLTDRRVALPLLVPLLGRSGGFFGAMGQWLPSFVHPFAFSFFCAAALPRGAKAGYWACLAWFLTNVVFELGQHRNISQPLAEVIEREFGHGAFTEALAGYFVKGTYDMGDIVAAALGALAAAMLLLVLQRRWEKCHAG